MAGNLMKDLDVAVDHNAVSMRTWGKDVHPDAGDQPPRHDGRWADKGKNVPSSSGAAQGTTLKHHALREARIHEVRPNRPPVPCTAESYLSVLKLEDLM